MRISIKCALTLSFAALIPFCQDRCLNRTSATMPKMPLAITSAGPRPSRSNGASNTSKTADRPWFSAFMLACARSARSRDVAEPLELVGDLLVALRALELDQLLLQYMHDELLVRGVARDRRDLLDAIDQVLVQLDLVAAAEHLFLCF